MDAVKFVEERRRMFTVPGASPKYSLFNLSTRAADVVKEVEAWSAAHPRRTRQSVFLEQWPNASLADDGVLTFCPKRVDFNISCLAECHSVKKCSDCRREFWTQEVE